MFKSVCIIDDDPIYVFGTKKIMETTQFSNNFSVYKNGKQAIEYLIPKMISGETLPDVILLDLNMPIMDGWQVLDELVKTSSHQKMNIFIASSSVDNTDLERAKSYDIVNRYIVKPFSIAKIKMLMDNTDNEFKIIK